ncbi:MAG: DMT family transporter [Candidatus Competibacteraceae bacterium]|nr:DMT family transporter [Candidatus Competibacteraceae bacterium]
MRNNIDERWLGFTALFSTGLIMASFGVLIRWLDTELSAVQQIGLRYALALMLAVLWVLWSRPAYRTKGVNGFLLLGYSFAFPLGVIFFTYAVVSTKIAVAVFALYGASLLVAQAGGILVFGERLTRHRMGVLLLCFVGLVCFVAPAWGENSIGWGFFRCGGGIMRWMREFFRKYLTGLINHRVLVLIQLLGGLVITAIIMLMASAPIMISISWTTWGVALVFGALILVASYLPLIGFRHFDLGLGAVVLASELAFAPLFAILFFSEYPTLTECAAGVLILAAVIWASRPENAV